MKVERKGLRFQLKGMSEKGAFTGYASTRNKDLVGDVIQEGAFKRTIDQNGGKFPILFFHDPTQPCGISTSMQEDGHGLFTEGQLDLDTECGQKVYSGVQKGYIDRLSIGFSAVDSEYDPANETRVLKEIRLYEYSMITKNFAAQPEALITGVKTLGGTMYALPEEWLDDAKACMSFQDLPLADKDVSWDASAAVDRVKTWAKAEDAPNAKFKKAFLWYDSDKPDEFGSYKMPIADIINGKLTAVPRGIMAAAGALSGARGGVSIPDADKEQCKSHLGRYYKKMGMTPPWEGQSSLFSVAEMVKELKTLKELKAGRVLSAANLELVQNAVAALEALIEAAGVTEPDDATDSGNGGSPGKADLIAQTAAASAAGTDLLLSARLIVSDLKKVVGH